jgi:cytochrome c-type biogenesis protein CcsB
MSTLQTATFWVTLLAYLAATVMAFAALAWKRRSWLDTAVTKVALAGAVLHALALGVRWYEAGHFPYVGNYEGALFGAFLVSVALQIVVRLWPRTIVSGIVVLPMIVVTMGYGLVQMEPVGPVTPVYQSPWLLVHFVFSWTTYAVYTVVAGLAVAQLIEIHAEERDRADEGVAAWLPSSERIDDISLPLVGFGFLMNALLLVTGAIWAFRLWGQYWSWDAVEIWSLLTWLGYGFYLHARLTLGWRGRRLAWVAIIALVGITMATWGVQFLPTSYHLFKDLGGQVPTMSRPQ